VAQLAAPLLGPAGEPRVCFAGEATCAAHMGTAHGAFMSGEREAARLLAAWGLGGAAAGAEAELDAGPPAS
jgi:hypothetical protein